MRRSFYHMKLNKLASPRGTECKEIMNYFYKVFISIGTLLLTANTHF